MLIPINEHGPTNDHAPPPAVRCFGTSCPDGGGGGRGDRRPARGRHHRPSGQHRHGVHRCPGPRGAADILRCGQPPLPAARLRNGCLQPLHAGRSAVPGTAADAGHRPQRVRRERQPLGTGTRTRAGPDHRDAAARRGLPKPGYGGRPAATERRSVPAEEPTRGRQSHAAWLRCQPSADRGGRRAHEQRHLSGRQPAERDRGGCQRPGTRRGGARPGRHDLRQRRHRWRDGLPPAWPALLTRQQPFGRWQCHAPLRFRRQRDRHTPGLQPGRKQAGLPRQRFLQPFR